MSNPSFKSALREADALLSDQRMPERCDRRIRRSMAGSPSLSLRSLSPWLAFGVAVGVLIVLLIGPWAESPSRSTMIAGFLVQEPTADFVAGEDKGGIAVSAGDCRLEAEALGMTILVSGPTQLRPEGKAVRLVHGAVDVQVRKRRPNAPATMLVSGGSIDVLGTRFEVNERGHAGRVVLHEGAIRFTRLDGRVVNLSPGESVSWSQSSANSAPTDSATVSSPSPTASSLRPTVEETTVEKGTVDGSGEEETAEQAREAGAPTMEPDVSAVLERVAVMRSRGEYEQAISFLRQTLAGDLRPTTRERLEFELGSILTYQIRDRTRACEYWRKQRASNPSGRYDVEAFKAAEALGCQSQ